MKNRRKIINAIEPMKLLSKLCLFFVVQGSFAQTAPDFTITTTDGVTRNLYNTLDSGKYILLDFFYPSCQGCWFYAPIIEQSYQNHGAGSGNIEYWGINGGNEIVNDVSIIAYAQQYGITNPLASGADGNGKYVDSLYFATYSGVGYPTYAIICPDRTVFWEINYPPVETEFDSYFSDSCGVVSMSENTFDTGLKIYPNPTIGIFNVLGAVGDIEVLDLFGRLVFTSATSEINMSDQPKGIYYIRVREVIRKLVIR